MSGVMTSVIFGEMDSFRSDRKATTKVYIHMVIITRALVLCRKHTRERRLAIRECEGQTHTHTHKRLHKLSREVSFCSCVVHNPLGEAFLAQLPMLDTQIN